MSAQNALEEIIYRMVFDESFLQATIDTTDLELVLFSTLPDETGASGVELVGTGYAPVPLITSGTNVFEAYTGAEETNFGAGVVTTWTNSTNINFGTNSGGGNWPSIVGWGIRLSSSPNTIYLADQFLNGALAPVSYTVGPAQEFIIPTGSFIVAID